VLFAKPIVIILTVASLTVLTQFFPWLNLNYSLGKNFAVDRSIEINSIQKVDYITVDYLCEISNNMSCLQLSRKPLINKINHRMKIKFRQSGGYAGLRMGCDLDIKSLPAKEATKLEALVKESGILQTSVDRSKNTADVINYEITIETREGTHQVIFDDLNLPEKVLPLLDYLQSQAKPIR
jgi:hypothetical protein